MKFPEYFSTQKFHGTFEVSPFWGGGGGSVSTSFLSAIQSIEFHKQRAHILSKANNVHVIQGLDWEKIKVLCLILASRNVNNLFVSLKD